MHALDSFVISPWVEPRSVSHTLFDLCSCLGLTQHEADTVHGSGCCQAVCDVPGRGASVSVGSIRSSSANADSRSSAPVVISAPASGCC